MDSIRENRTKEDVIEEIRLELAEDIENRKSIILVEGSDDILFVKGVFDDNVVAVESFSGVHDIEKVLEDPHLQIPNIIAIRDRDYIDVSMSNSPCSFTKSPKPIFLKCMSLPSIQFFFLSKLYGAKHFIISTKKSS